MKKLSPFASLVAATKMALAGRVHFPRQRLNEVLWLDGEKWVVFRHVKIDPLPNQPDAPGAIFQPRFHLAGMSPGVNQLFSWLPIPFFIGLPGFRSKLWLINPDTGDFSGYYEWDTVEDAQNYQRSFAVKFMTGRSVPGSVSFKVTPR